MSRFYIGAGRRLSDEDFIHLAKAHEMDEALLRAVAQVEARNKGSHSSGALVCLYEPHIAHRMASGEVRKKLVAAGLAYPKWGTKKYPKTSFTRIDRCAEIAGEEIAALSTSWGLGQIMGFNHKATGHASAVEMVEWFAESEANQLEGMILFIKSSPAMFDALMWLDWKGFARLYNGPGYAKHNYHGRLANAHDQWLRKIAKRPPLAKPAPEPPPKPEPRQTILQIILAAFGRLFRGRS